MIAQHPFDPREISYRFSQPPDGHKLPARQSHKYWIEKRRGLAPSFDRYLILGLTAYFLAGLLLLNHFRYQLNPDAISYISIARHYLEGHWNAAINAYWSPLYSWLLIPFFAIGIDNLLAAKLLNLALGGAILFGSWQLSYVINLAVLSRRFLIALLIPIVLRWSYAFITPDVLTVALLVFYLTIVIRPDFTHSNLLAVIAGATGALAFLSKAYALPFVLVTFVLLSGWHIVTLHLTKNRILKHLLLFGFSFAAIAVPWIALISFKYHRLTSGTAAAYNFAIIGPKHPGHPMWTAGMFAPSNQYALSAWEDPTYLPLHHWSPFSSPSYLHYWLQKIVSNWADLFGMLNELSYLAIPCLIVAATVATAKMHRHAMRYDAVLALVISSLLFLAGYSLVVFEQRYVWLLAIVSLICGLYLIEHLVATVRVTKAVVVTSAGLLTLSYIVPPIFWLHDNADVDRRYYETSMRLPDMHGSRFASNDMRGLYFAYYKQARFHGIPHGTDEQIKRDLEANGIDYYFLFGVRDEPTYLQGLRRINTGQVVNLRIYKIDSAGL